MAHVFIGVIHSYVTLLLLLLEQTKMTHFLLGKKRKERKGRGQMDKLSKDALTPLVSCFPPAKPHLLRVHSALS